VSRFRFDRTGLWHGFILWVGEPYVALKRSEITMRWRILRKHKV
jgi:hypothetical protein